MKKIFALLLLSIGITAYSQQDIDVPVKPRPFDFAIPQLSPEPKAPMKRMAWIKDNDTLKLYETDRKGNLAASYDYSSNKRVSGTTYTYTGTLLKQSVYTTPSDQTITYYKYTPSGKYAEWGKTTAKKGSPLPATPDFKWIFEYDSKDRLVKKYYADGAKAKTLNSEYAYNHNGQLASATSNGQTNTVFEYGPKGLLERYKDTFNGFENGNYAYEYNVQGKVTAQISKLYNAGFTYDGDNMASAAYTLKNGKEEHITLRYKDSLLSEVVIKRSDFSTFSPFLISSRYIDKMPFELRIEFLRDSHNNTKELKYFVNGVFKYAEKFAIDYY